MDTAKKSDTGISCGANPATENKDDKQPHERLKAIPPKAPDHAYRIERVTSLEDMRKIFELRYEIYNIQLLAFPPNSYGLEIDEYDGDATHFQATLEGSVISTVRLLPPHRGEFPMDDHGFILPSNLPRDTTLEVSRIISRPLAGRRGKKATVDVMKFAYDWSVERGITHWIYSANMMTIAFLNRNRFLPDQIGEPQEHHNDVFYPFVMPLQERHRFSWF
jgi:N-acyl-L-homoserine lactone synthetase